MSNIIGREKQIAEIQKLYNSGKSELLVVYGRRRVGKTFLIDESLKGRITFRHAGLSAVDHRKSAKTTMKDQLKHFFYSLKLHGCNERTMPKSWLDAFFMLEKLLMALDNGERQVVFIDELPLMDTPRSGFLSAFEGFWNTWACHRDNLMVVVCGSANSWILDNLIDSHGGLYGRTTFEIHLSPFSLGECREFYRSRQIVMSDYDVVQSYMTLGGIPYYMGYVKRELSMAQNIDELFWGKRPRLHDEFDRLFESAFDTPQEIKKIVLLLAKRHKGYTRQEIIEGVGTNSGGLLSKRLRALVASDFVTAYVPFGKKKSEIHYKLSDPFCIFYTHFVSGTIESADFWSSNINSQSVISWRGVAFEEVCMNHIPQIKQALGISGVASKQSAWTVHGEEGKKGLQIDLLIKREDNVVNMCEIKFYSDEFTVDKDYDMTIRHRMTALAESLPKKFAIHPTIITTFGLKKGIYNSIFVRELTMACLFLDILVQQ